MIAIAKLFHLQLPTRPAVPLLAGSDKTHSSGDLMDNWGFIPGADDTLNVNVKGQGEPGWAGDPELPLVGKRRSNGLQDMTKLMKHHFSRKTAVPQAHVNGAIQDL